MTDKELLTIDRLVGRMEEAIATLKMQVPVLKSEIERTRQEHTAECARHWEITNSMKLELAAAVLARKTLDEEAASARETVIAEAADASARIAREAALSAEAKAAAEAVIAEAVAAVAKTTREALAASTTAERSQRHWIIERVLPFVLPAATALAAWLLAKGGT